MSSKTAQAEQQVRRVRLFREGETWFIRDGGFSLPFCDGRVMFCLDAAMVAIGGRKIKDGEWNIALDAIMVHDYLTYLTTASVDFETARRRWVRQFVLAKKNQDHQLPFNGAKINWDALANIVDVEVSKRFPLCV